MSNQKFIPSTQLTVDGDIYTLRLSRYMRLQLEKEFNLNVDRCYSLMALGGDIVDKFEFAAIFWALLRGGGHKVSKDRACDIITAAVDDDECGTIKLYESTMEALSAYFMTKEQFKEYKRLIEVYKSSEDEEDTEKK
ncbi:hypothetical protein [Bacillus wiedmannii]|uniref:hypothetical protein n=1 Tax=Bacillus wiedmannii TaxID=1890302 RepID=UPI000BF9101A|nr:hypothetical protein [Bacillus wiedmannii]PEP21517.1 hypothetical protein CN580_21335 [Bacillus wiedmannii]